MCCSPDTKFWLRFVWLFVDSSPLFSLSHTNCFGVRGGYEGVAEWVFLISSDPVVFSFARKEPCRLSYWGSAEYHPGQEYLTKKYPLHICFCCETFKSKNKPQKSIFFDTNMFVGVFWRKNYEKFSKKLKNWISEKPWGFFSKSFYVCLESVWSLQRNNLCFLTQCFDFKISC